MSKKPVSKKTLHNQGSALEETAEGAEDFLTEINRLDDYDFRDGVMLKMYIDWDTHEEKLKQKQLSIFADRVVKAVNREECEFGMLVADRIIREIPSDLLEIREQMGERAPSLERMRELCEASEVELLDSKEQENTKIFNRSLETIYSKESTMEAKRKAINTIKTHLNELASRDYNTNTPQSNKLRRDIKIISKHIDGILREETSIKSENKYKKLADRLQPYIKKALSIFGKKTAREKAKDLVIVRRTSAKAGKESKMDMREALTQLRKACN